MSGNRFPSELVQSPIFLLKKLGMTAKEQTVDAYEGTGHSPYHHAILAVLDEGLRETQGAIADALGYDRGQLVGILDELEEAGLVERRRDPDDRRRQVVLVTPAGTKALAQMRKLSKQADDEFLAKLTPQEREQLHTLLLKLAEEHLPNCRLTAASQQAALVAQSQ